MDNNGGGCRRFFSRATFDEDGNIETTAPAATSSSSLIAVPSSNSNSNSKMEATGPRSQENNNGSGSGSGNNNNTIHGLDQSGTDTTNDSTLNSIHVLLPIEIQMALLEDTVFGWTHLTSEFFGHTLAPAFVYLLIWAASTHLLARAFVALDGDNEDEDEDGSGGTYGPLPPRVATFVWVFSHFVALVAAGLTFCVIRRRRRVWFRNAYGTQGYRRDRRARRREVRRADRDNVLGRMIGSIRTKKRARDLVRAKRRFARKHTDSSFRHGGNGGDGDGIFVRGTGAGGGNGSGIMKSRRRRKAGPTPGKSTGGGGVGDDDDRTLDLSIASSCESLSGSDDERTRMGGLQQHQPPWRRRPGGGDDDDGGHNRCYPAITQDHVPIPRIRHLAYAHGGFFGAAPFLLADPQWVRVLRRLLPDVYVEISRRVLFSPSSKLIHWAENNPVVAAYGAVQALERLEEEEDGGGGGGGDDSRAGAIPIERDSSRNNYHSGTNDGGMPPKNRAIPDLEWDVFVDPRLVRRVQAVLDAIDELSTTHGALPEGGSSVYNPPPARTDNSVHLQQHQQHEQHPQHQPQHHQLPLPPWDGTNSNTDGSAGGSQHSRVLQYLEKELTKRAKELTDQLLIAHGNILQLLVEQTGVLKDLNYSRVQRTRRTLGGGFYARQWMAIFAEALRLGSTLADDDDQYSIARSSFLQQDGYSEVGDDDGDGDDGDSPASWSCLDTCLAESVGVIQQITGVAQPLGIVLDLKSRHVPPRVWSLVVDTLQTAGIRVVGIASFEMSEIRGVRDYCKTTTVPVPAGQQRPLQRPHRGSATTALSLSSPVNSSSPVKEILFVHSAGDIQAACQEGKVQQGDHVFFNGGSLIIEESGRSSLWAALSPRPACGGANPDDSFDPRAVLDGYKIHPCGVPSPSAFHAGSGNFGQQADERSTTTTPLTKALATLQDYKRHYQFSMGIYVQEFAIDEAAARLLVELVNRHPDLYDLGFAWGGINGMTVRGIQPGRFTSTDGYWNQRRVGKRWEDR